MPMQIQKPQGGPKPVSAPRPSFRAALRSDGVLEICVYGDIVDAATMALYEDYGYSTDGMASAMSIKKEIDSAGGYSSITLRINSPGGDAFEGVAAYNILRSQGKPVNVFVDGVAASSASIVAMAGDTITMGVNSMMMIHNAWMACWGNAAELRKAADLLDKVSESIGATYVKKTGKSADEIKALMDAETWLSAKDCLELGLCTAISEQEADAEVMALAGKFKDRAKAMRARVTNLADDQCECTCDNCQDGKCSDCTMQGCDDPNCIDCPMQSTNNSAETPKESNLSLYEARLKLLGRH
jgi:ATP-dependent protease ClpP protease subunit